MLPPTPHVFCVSTPPGSRLDLRNAYHPVRIREDEWKMDLNQIRAVKDWPRQGTTKQLQQFLGFLNFYWKFIQGYNSVATPLRGLTPALIPIKWTPEAKHAFERLKDLFTSAPIPILPDPARQFVVEVDASDLGVGAIL